MSRRICVYLGMALSIMPVAAWGQAVDTAPGLPVLTLEDSINAALGQNRTLLLSEEAVHKAAGRVVESQGVGHPQINFSTEVQKRSEEQDIPLAVSIDAQNQLVFLNAPLSPSAVGAATVSVNQIIDISGFIHTGTKIAELGKQSAQLNVGRTRNDIILQLKQVYYDVLRTEKLVTVAEEAQQNAEIRRKTAQALVDAGISSAVDVIRAEASIASAQQSVISAKNAVQISKAVLNNLMGRDVNTPFEVAATAEVIAPVADYATYLPEALAHRPETSIAATNSAIAQQQLKLSQRGERPSLVVSAAAAYDVARHIAADPNASIAAALVFPISDGGQTRGRVAQANSDIKSAAVAADDTKARIALEVKAADVDLQNAGEKLATAQRELDQANESLRLSRLRYEQGITNQLEVSDAELLVTQARTNVVNDTYAELVLQAVMDRALGRYAK